MAKKKGKKQTFEFIGFRGPGENLFELTCIRHYGRKTHDRFIIIRSDRTVEVVDNTSDLFNYPDDTNIIYRWQGQWRSDYFHFTLKEFKDYIKKHPPTNGQDC